MGGAKGAKRGRTSHQPVGEPSAKWSWEVSTKRTLGAIVGIGGGI